MTFLKIPCTPFSRKIILRENHGEPVKLTRYHSLWSVLRPHAPGEGLHAGPVSTRLTSHFLVECDDRMAARLQSHHSDAGVVLHTFHIDAMCRFIWSLGIAKIEATKAIDIWFETYGIDEEDYSRETAHRAWIRANQEFSKVFGKKRGTKTPLNVLDLRRPGDDIFHLKSDKEIDLEAARISAALLAERPQTPKYVLTQIHQWLYVECGRRKVRAVAKKFNKSRRRTYVAIERVRGYLQYDSGFAAVVRPTIAA